MEIPILIENNMYLPETVSIWRNIWWTICKIAYNNVYDITQEIITKPKAFILKDGNLIEDGSEFAHTEIYNYKGPMNYYDLTLDSTWKMFSGEPHIVKSLKRLHVPRALFEDLGVRQWFAYSFPCCVVTYWEE